MAMPRSLIEIFENELVYSVEFPKICIIIFKVGRIHLFQEVELIHNVSFVHE